MAQNRVEVGDSYRLFSKFSGRRRFNIQIIRRMSDKKNVCRYEDYIQPRSPPLNLFHTCSSLSRSLAEFKLDRIYPRNINMKLNLEGKQNTTTNDRVGTFKNSTHNRSINCSQNKFYHQFLNMKDMQMKNHSKKSKISHIFNIRSINLVDKNKYDQQRSEIDKKALQLKYTGKDLKRNSTEKIDKDPFKGLNLLLVEKRNHSVGPSKKKKGIEKKNSAVNQKVQSKTVAIMRSGDNFQIKLHQYYQYLRQHSQGHGLELKEIENYAKHALTVYVGKGNNGHLIKELMKKRWWWTINDDKSKKNSLFVWTQLKQKGYFTKKQFKDNNMSQSLSRRSESPSKAHDLSQNSLSASQCLPQNLEPGFHNHFQNNQFLGNKKALYYNMKSFYERQKKNVFDYLPVTFHIKRYQDENWFEFEKYFYEDLKKHEGERRLWILKPGQNTNRGNGITIHSQFQKIKELIQNDISQNNNPKKTYIIQKYIDKPFLYNRRKFDIRCYMLLARLNGSIKGYWYKEGYIRTSCYEYHLEDSANSFIHLTNDAIQINCQKYGKYEDGNKLSYHNFQKYLDAHYKGVYNFTQDICPKLREIAKDSIQASYHLMGKWNGQPSFEIFGLDFMIDENFKPWLIEINTNPCLETSSTTLERVIPRMVDSAFKLTLDLLFPPPLNWQNSKKHYLPNKVSNNLFQLIFDESKKKDIYGCMSDEIIIEMGQIQEDNEVYQQSGETKSSEQTKQA